jgi:hypothetical protein
VVQAAAEIRAVSKRDVLSRRAGFGPALFTERP